MEVDEMIEIVQTTIELLRSRLYSEADRHYDYVIYQPQIGVEKVDQYANKFAKEELEIIGKLQDMLSTLDEV